MRPVVNSWKQSNSRVRVVGTVGLLVCFCVISLSSPVALAGAASPLSAALKGVPASKYLEVTDEFLSRFLPRVRRLGDAAAEIAECAAKSCGYKAMGLLLATEANDVWTLSPEGLAQAWTPGKKGLSLTGALAKVSGRDALAVRREVSGGDELSAWLSRTLSDQEGSILTLPVTVTNPEYPFPVDKFHAVDVFQIDGTAYVTDPTFSTPLMTLKDFSEQTIAQKSSEYFVRFDDAFTLHRLVRPKTNYRLPFGEVRINDRSFSWAHINERAGSSDLTGAQLVEFYQQEKGQCGP